MGVFGIVRIGGSVDATVDVVTAFAVVGDDGRRVVVVGGMVDDANVVVGPITAVLRDMGLVMPGSAVLGDILHRHVAHGFGRPSGRRLWAPTEPNFRSIEVA